MTVREMLSRIDAHELTEWLAYYRIEPFGESVADQRMGIQAALLANINRDSKHNREPYRPTDFIPWHEANVDTGPVLLDDPEAQSKLITATIFGART